jgi:hypothetical protein
MAVLTVGSGGVPVGNYTATFAGTEVQPANKEKSYPPGIRWKFTIDAGPCAGQTASRITGSVPSPKNNCGKVLSGLLGRPLREGEQIDPDQFLNKRYMVVVAATEGGATRVEGVMGIQGA